jgi:hypothetical protein
MDELIVVNEKLIEKNNSFLIENAPLNYLYGKEVYFSTGFSDDKFMLYQMVGNLGAFAIDYELENSISVYTISDSLFEKLRTGEKEESLISLEIKLNSKGQPFKDLLIITESALINFIEKRNVYYGDKVTKSLTDDYLKSRNNIKLVGVNREKFRSEYVRLTSLHTIKDCLDLFDIFLEYLWMVIREHHKDEVFSYANKDAKILNQMMFTKQTHLKKIVEGVGYQAKDGYKLNNIIDPTIVASLIRNVFETVSVFNLIFRNPKSADEKAIIYGLWVISGLNYRQRFDSNASSSESISKLTEEKKQIDQIVKEIKDTELFKSLNEKNKNKIDNIIKQKDYKIRFNNTDVVQLTWQDMCEVMGLNEELFGNIYNYFSLYAHPSYVSVFQFEYMFEKTDEAFKFLTAANLKYCCSLMSIYIADYINLFPDTKVTFEKLDIEKQIALNALNKLLRGDAFSINDAWEILN